jgi:hypothetical protein
VCLYRTEHDQQGISERGACGFELIYIYISVNYVTEFLGRGKRIFSLEQGFLTFFVPWTPVAVS